MKLGLRNRFAALLFLAAATASACSGGGPPSHDRVVRVDERDFKISTAGSLPEGDVVLSAHNNGPDMHELIVVRTDGRQLPLRRDGITVDEDALSHAEVGAVEPYEPGTSEELHVHLRPGTYRLFCNMSGHYLGGMSSVVVVT